MVTRAQSDIPSGTRGASSYVPAATLWKGKVVSTTEWQAFKPDQILEYTLFPCVSTSRERKRYAACGAKGSIKASGDVKKQTCQCFSSPNIGEF
ncbi:hypothetical protein HBI55_167650 [Parastagonospora nodorum]|nr:hypothetical protein HBI54_201120 [Parastagonospora nodorum]KAH6300613.1 hypothetical protein HBI39_134110 [Parastagonospora nodorum]KAH6488845.1 hypothetical protein HBI55_167650 [Parastagonospora nodorum]